MTRLLPLDPWASFTYLKTPLQSLRVFSKLGQRPPIPSMIVCSMWFLLFIVLWTRSARYTFPLKTACFYSQHMERGLAQRSWEGGAKGGIGGRPQESRTPDSKHHLIGWPSSSLLTTKPEITLASAKATFMNLLSSHGQQNSWSTAKSHVYHPRWDFWVTLPL